MQSRDPVEIRVDSAFQGNLKSPSLEIQHDVRCSAPAVTVISRVDEIPFATAGKPSSDILLEIDARALKVLVFAGSRVIFLPDSAQVIEPIRKLYLFLLLMRRAFIVISTSLLLFIFGSTTQAQSVTHTAWERMRGLPANVIYTMFFDRDGFLWLGTEDGAFRYDGYQFQQFTIQDGLIDNDVFQIQQDSLGRIWFMTNKGWPCYYQHGLFFSGKNTSWLASVRPTRMALSFYADPNSNRIWYATLDTAYCFSGEQITHRIGYKMHDDVSGFFQKIINWNGSIWLVHNAGYRSIDTGEEIPFQSRIHSVHNKIYHDGRTLYYFDNNMIRVWDLVERKEVLTHKKEVGQNFLCFLKRENADEFLISNMERNYRLQGRSTPGITPVDDIPVEMATLMLIDREGNRWLSSLTHGLWVQYRIQPPRSEKLNRTVFPPGEPCWSLSYSRDGFYAGFSKGAASVNRLIPSRDQFIKLPIQDSRLRVNNVVELPKERWFITGNELVAISNSHARYVTRNYSVKDVFLLNNHAFMATSTGLTHMMVDSLDYYPATVLNSMRISRVVAPSRDSIWMGGILGLKLHVKGRDIEHLPWTDSILNGHVSSMIHHRSGAVVFSTIEHGIGIIDKNQLYAIRIAGNLPIHNAIQLAEDQDSAVWVLTNRRLLRFRFSIEQGKLTTDWTDYSKAIDVDNSRINAILPMEDSLYLATDQGVFRHPLTDTRHNPITPLIRMESISADNNTYVGQSEVHLPADSRYVRFRYVGIAFQAKGNIQYRYRLEPLDQQWIYTSAREVAYPYLNHGSYRFVVEASLPDGSWSAPVYAVLTIETPFVRTLWFWLFVAVVIIGLVALFFYLRLTAFKARHRLQQETLIFDKKLAELELQALQLQMNPHFIFNAIYAIQGFYASGDKVVAKDYIARLASLVRMIFESGKHNQIPLDHEIRLLREYVGLFQLRMEVPIEFQVDIDDRIHPNEIMIPPMLIQPIVENALQYGLAPLRSGALLHIRFLKEGDHLHVMIEDNGVGRAKSARIKFDMPKSSSGLRITEQRIQLLYREKPSFPVFEISDTDPSRENPGTIVHLRIPLEL